VFTHQNRDLLESMGLPLSLRVFRLFQGRALHTQNPASAI